MLTDKSVLLEQINTAIEKNSCKKSAEHISHTEISDPVYMNREITDKNYFSNTRHADLLKKMEQRLDTLEDQNDHLLYFIHFLYKNFPDLVKDILSHESHAVNGMEIKGKPRESLLVVKNDHQSLTRREIEILHLLVKGLCAKEIANMLFISETTVITHKKNMKEKLNAKNTVELISKAFTILLKIS